MTESISLEDRRKRALFRSWHRGMKEMDMILGGYADSHAEHMSLDDVLLFEELMSHLDRDLFKWFTGEGAVPPQADTPLFRAICAFHNIELD